jgi:uncharacterized peroxidase-related enzyme
MTRVALIDRTATTPDRKELLDSIHGAFGATPNMFRAIANSPAALRSLWGSFRALGGGVLGAKLGEQFAVAVADRNGCEYCLAAHTMLGKNAGATADQMREAQNAESTDPKVRAALQFAARLVDTRGRVKETDLKAVRDAGYADEQIVEIIAHVALNLFTNYVNNALAVELDFPATRLRNAA